VSAEAPGAALGRGWFEHSPFVQELGMRLVDLSPDVARVELPFRPELATVGDVVHGGAIGSLVDTTAALAAWSSHEQTDAKWGTIGISLNLLASARGETVVADARVTRRGRLVCFCHVDVTAGERPIAEALVTYRLG
jgi:uncharacterized protein (TIGR00369 family)